LHKNAKTSFEAFLKAVEDGITVSDGKKELMDSHIMSEVNRAISIIKRLADGELKAPYKKAFNGAQTIGMTALAAASLLRADNSGVTLDVGLDRFVQNLTVLLTNATASHIAGKDEAAFQQFLVADVSKTLSNGTRPIKQAIGQNWVKLKEEKRDDYIQMLTKKFAEIYDDSYASFLKHVTNVVAVGTRSLNATEKGVDDALQSPSRLFFKSLKDYEELLYMSNIFLQFHQSKRPSMLQLSLVRVV